MTHGLAIYLRLADTGVYLAAFTVDHVYKSVQSELKYSADKSSSSLQQEHKQNMKM